MEIFQKSALCLVVFLAAVHDLWRGQIPNMLIGAGFFLALFFRTEEKGILNGLAAFLSGGAVPLLFLAGLYYFRMVGAGDVKLFSVLGCFLGIGDFCRCFVAVGALAAVEALGILLLRGNFRARFRYFFSYAAGVLRKEEWKPYRDPKDSSGEFHLAVPILVGTLCYVGGII